MTIITIKDMRACGICADASIWCKQHGIDWRDFVKNGVQVDKLRATGDSLSKIDRLEKIAKRRIKNGR